MVDICCRVRNGAIDVWVDLGTAVKCLRLSVRKGRPVVFDHDADEALTWPGPMPDTVDEVVAYLGRSVWLDLHAFCADYVGPRTFTHAVNLADVFAAVSPLPSPRAVAEP